MINYIGDLKRSFLFGNPTPCAMGFKGDMPIMPLVVSHSIFHLFDYIKRTLVYNSAVFAIIPPR